MTLVACIGGGQLGRMLGLAGSRSGSRFRFLDPSPDAPAARGGRARRRRLRRPGRARDGSRRAPTSSRTSSRTSRSSAVRALAPLPPPRALELGQDRLVEKELFRRLGIPTARFGSLDDTGLPALVKTRRLGYDGKGQRRARALDEPLGEDELAEEIVPFDRELSILAVRGRDGETRFWPLAENVHRGGILRVSRAPAAERAAGRGGGARTRLLDELDYVGVLALELFEVGGRLLANEFAPRVHNTGHWTIDGAATSQFENHLRAILGLPLGSTERARTVGDGQPDRRRTRRSQSCYGSPGAHAPPLRQGAAPRPQARARHARRGGEETVAEAIELVEAAADG